MPQFNSEELQANHYNFSTVTTMKSSSLFRGAFVALTILVVFGISRASATSVARGFVSENPRMFEYNSGQLAAGDDLYAAFSVFGTYPGHFDMIYISYFPSAFWANDCEAVIGTFNLNSYYWSGDNISGTGRFYEYGVKPGLRVTATYQNAVSGQSIENVNIRGYYNVPDSGSTIALLAGTLTLVWSARAFRRNIGKLEYRV
ncbi:MAG: hypothetical protein V4640_02905 [Verrucomicrobiota bacterium]